MSGPRWSVVLPTYRRLDVLRRVLDAYERQTPTDLDFEIVVVDDGSGDGTAEFLAAHRPRRYTLRFATQPNSGPAAARNRALGLARGRWVLFTGDDIEPTPDLLAQHHRAHQQAGSPGVAILGLIRWPPGTETTATMRHIDGVGAQQFSYHFMEDGDEYDFRHLYTSNVSLACHWLEAEPGPFSTDFPDAAFEDAELGYRLALRGLRIVYREAAVAYHHHPYTAAAFVRRQERCGRMAALLDERHPEVRHFLDFEALEDLRLELATGRVRVPGLGSLARWERRTTNIAEHFDPLPWDTVDVLLRPLFRHAYLRGLAHAVTPEIAEDLLAILYVRHLVPAVHDLAHRARTQGLPTPAADFQAFGVPG